MNRESTRARAKEIKGRERPRAGAGSLLGVKLRERKREKEKRKGGGGERERRRSKKSEVTSRGELGWLTALPTPFFGHLHRALTYAHDSVSHDTHARICPCMRARTETI